MTTDRDDSIDPNSQAYLFGKIMARLNEGEKVMERLAESVDETRKAVGSLPCDRSTQRITNLEEWQRERDETNREVMRAGLAFRYGLVLVGASALISALVSLLVVKI